MSGVRAMATRWVDDAFPGFVEVVLIDASGHEWVIVDKVPIIGDDRLSPDAAYPISVLLDCDVEPGATPGCVAVTLRHGVETAGGQAQFVVTAGDVHKD